MACTCQFSAYQDTYSHMIFENPYIVDKDVSRP